jgi:polyhydroxyalkanoate synthesis regulator phasin
MSDNKKSSAKSFTMIDNSMEKMWDMWLVSLGSLSGTQDQIEDLTKKQLDRNKAARQELNKVGEELSKQMRRNQEQVQSLVKETVLNNYEHLYCSNQNLVSELSKKVDDLSIYKGGELVDHMMTPLKQWLTTQSGNSSVN